VPLQAGIVTSMYHYN